jgi:hypothetical protein
LWFVASAADAVTRAVACDGSLARRALDAELTDHTGKRALTIDTGARAGAERRAARVVGSSVAVVVQAVAAFGLSGDAADTQRLAADALLKARDAFTHIASALLAEPQSLVGGLVAVVVESVTELSDRVDCARTNDPGGGIAQVHTGLALSDPIASALARYPRTIGATRLVAPAEVARFAK